MGKAPTIRDVAAAAGVSIATVSRVINGRNVTSVPVVKAVREAICATGFRPNMIGRRLKTARTSTLCILVPSLKNPIFADAVHGMESAAEAAGYSLLLTSSGYLPTKETAAIELLLANRVEGIILTVANEARSPTIALLRREKIPFVLVFNPPLRKGVSTVTIDNRAAAYAVVERLIALGHRRVAMIAGAFQASDRSGLRRAGFEDALTEHGLRPGPVVEVGFEALDLTDHCRRLLAAADPPTALFCSTDMLAIAAIRSLRRLGLGVPRDVSVAGFDGIAAGEWMSPSLMTVRQPAEAMGVEAVRHLLARLADGVPPQHVELSYELCAGESCGPPPTGGARAHRGHQVDVHQRATVGGDL